MIYTLCEDTYSDRKFLQIIEVDNKDDLGKILTLLSQFTRTSHTLIILEESLLSTRRKTKKEKEKETEKDKKEGEVGQFSHVAATPFPPSCSSKY